MTVEAPKRTRTDERLDDLSEKVGGGFAQVDKRFERVEKRMDDGFARVDADIRELRGEVRGDVAALDAKFDAKFDKLDAKFNWLTLSLLIAALGIIGTMIGTSAS